MKKIEVQYQPTENVCRDYEPMDKCKNSKCSWFKHSQAGLQGGDYPLNYREDLVR